MASLWSARRVGAILSQPYRFLGQGAKLRAYVSADDRFVLKTPNTAEQFVRWFVEDDADVARLTALSGHRDPIDAARAMLARAQDSYRLAADELADETGLVFLHLAPTTDFDHRRVSIDGEPRLDADADTYIMQHRAELVRARIKASERAGDRAASLRVLDDVIDLIGRIWRQGITEDSFNFHNNYGYVGDTLIQFDIGEFFKSWDRVREEMRELKVLRQRSQAYLRRKYPDLADEFDARVRARLTPEALGSE